MKKNSCKKFTIYDMCSIAIFTAVISVLAQIAIPMPTGVPLTLQTFAVTLTAIVLGSKKGTAAVLVYLLLGAVGVPVFANLRGGIQALLSPTGGFLLSFPAMAFIIGLGAENKSKKWLSPLMIAAGTALNYLIGLIFYCINTGTGIVPGFFACVAPFLPSGVMFAVAAAMVGGKLRQRLLQTFYISKR